MSIENKKFLSVDEVVAYLPMTKKGIYNWISRKQIPQSVYFKLGRKIVFKKAELDTWLESGAKLNKPKHNL